ASMTRGVDTMTFDPALRDRPDAAGAGVNIGYVGRLSPEKNVRMLAAVEAALLSEGRMDARFTIVGDGKEREWLERTMRRATFLGTLRGEALAQAYANMDIFAFPSETETVGNVVLEAMASGVPVVAMDRGGHRFIVGGGGSAIVSGEGAVIDAVRQPACGPPRPTAMGSAAPAAALTRPSAHAFAA